MKGHFRIWPVPSEREIFIESSGQVTGVIIFDSLGRKVLSFLNPLGIRVVSLEKLAPGLYILLAEISGNINCSGKIVKK